MSTKSEPISDVFSAGIIFHYLLFGCSVFEGKKYNEILTQNRACDFTFNKELYSKIPSNALDLLVKMLERDPKRRLSAEAALNHSFFSNEMDIEVPLKELKSIPQEMKSPISARKEVDTPLTQAGKVSNLFDFGKREVRPYYYS